MRRAGGRRCVEAVGACAPTPAAFEPGAGTRRPRRAPHIPDAARRAPTAHRAPTVCPDRGCAYAGDGRVRRRGDRARHPRRGCLSGRRRSCVRKGFPRPRGGSDRGERPRRGPPDSSSFVARSRPSHTTATHDGRVFLSACAARPGRPNDTPRLRPSRRAMGRAVGRASDRPRYKRGRRGPGTRDASPATARPGGRRGGRRPPLRARPRACPAGGVAPYGSKAAPFCGTRTRPRSSPISSRNGSGDDTSGGKLA